MTLIEKLHNLAKVLKKTYPDLRTGQAYYGALAELDYAIAAKIVGTNKDCFYNDSVVEDFLKEVSRLVEEYEKSNNN